MHNRRIVLSIVGSLGDLHPFIALAKELKNLEYEPILATAGLYREKVEAEGICFVAIRPDLTELVHALGMGLPEIAQRLASDRGFLIRKLILPFLSSTYSDLLRAVEGAALVVAHDFSAGAKLAAERQGVPFVNIILAPLLFLSAHDPPMGSSLPFVHFPGSSWMRNYNRALIWIWRKFMALSSRPLQKFRYDAGLLGSGEDPFFGKHVSTALNIGMYSPLLGDTQPDFPPRSAIAGFSFYDSNGGRPRRLDSPLQAFLDAGPAPVVFTLGSFAVHDAGDFYRQSIEAARKVKRRALVLATDDACEALRNKASSDVCIRAYVPHSLVFPRAAVVVHHGGMGTTGQALRAGKPQLIVPFFADQPDNARRICRLGIGRLIERKKYTAARATSELAHLLDDPKYAMRAIEVAKTVAREDGALMAAKRIDAYLLASSRAQEIGRASHLGA